MVHFFPIWSLLRQIKRGISVCPILQTFSCISPLNENVLYSFLSRFHPFSDPVSVSVTVCVQCSVHFYFFGHLIIVIIFSIQFDISTEIQFIRLYSSVLFSANLSNILPISLYPEIRFVLMLMFSIKFYFIISLFIQ